MRIVFMGTPSFSIPSLEKLNDNYDVVAVYTKAPKKSGRGQKENKSPVHILAEKLNIDIRTPRTLRDEKEVEYLNIFNLDLIVVAAYGLILPKSVLDIPKYGCFNVHGSILPRWRGASPLQRALLSGDNKTGITIMQMDEGLDTGNILSIEEYAINKYTDFEMLHDDMSILGANLLIQTIKDLEKDKIKSIPQPFDGITYAEKIQKEEGEIFFDTETSEEIDRKVRALGSTVGTWFVSKLGEKIKILKAKIVENSIGLDDTSKNHLWSLLEKEHKFIYVGKKLYVRCKNGILEILEMQRPGKHSMTSTEFLRGFKIENL